MAYTYSEAGVFGRSSPLKGTLCIKGVLSGNADMSPDASGTGTVAKTGSRREFLEKQN